MRNLLTALLLSTAGLSAQDRATSPPPTIEPTQESTLLAAAAGFNGADSLATIQQLIEAGADVNAADSEGNTPLIHLCTPIELDYRYTTEPHFAQAVDDAIALLLKNKASMLKENKKGCNAAFYLQSKPELLERLRNEDLLCKELSVRFPYDSFAFYRYIRKRTEQARLSRHEACRQYLIRKYCAPAYDLAEKRLADMLSVGSKRRFSYSDVCDLLAFMRLADEQRAHKFVHELHYWEHGEHLLEEKPAQVLEALNLLHWDVAPADLHKALRKLDSMLPSSPEEMIDCFAAAPMGILLEMIERREGDQALPLIRKYTNGNEAELAYRAYTLLLKRQQLPNPTPESLMARFTENGSPTMESLSPEQRRIYECAVTDAALSTGDISALNVDIVNRSISAFRDMKLNRHADIVATLMHDDTLTTDPYLIQSAHHKYTEQPPPSPRILMARYILNNPAQFAARQTEEK